MRLIPLLVALLAPLFGQDLVGLYLTWSADPATTMTVNWVDLRTSSSLDVHYRRIGTSEWKVAKGTKFAISDTTMQGRRVQLASDRKSTRLNSSHVSESRMPSSA